VLAASHTPLIFARAVASKRVAGEILMLRLPTISDATGSGDTHADRDIDRRCTPNAYSATSEPDRVPR